MRLHEDAVVRAGNIFDRDTGGKFSPAKIVFERADQRMTARSKQRDVSVVRLGGVPHQKSEMIFPQTHFAVRHVSEVNHFFQFKIFA